MVSDDADSVGWQRRWRFGSNISINSHNIFITTTIIITTTNIIITIGSSSSRRSNQRLRGCLFNFVRACRALLGLESGVASIGRLVQRGAKAI